MEFLISISVATAPVIILFTYVYVKDRYDPEPIKYLIACFVLGIVIALPAIYLELGLEELLGVGSGPDFFETLVFAMVTVSAVEEGLKYLVLRTVMYPRPEFNEPYDGIMYAVAISLGFAFIENIMYVSDGGIGVGFLRMFTAVPGHAMFAVVMGYFVGLAKFKKSTPSTILHIVGLGLAILIHGLYDFFLMWESPYVYISLLAFVVLIIGIILAVKAIRIHQQASPFKK